MPDCNDDSMRRTSQSGSIRTISIGVEDTMEPSWLKRPGYPSPMTTEAFNSTEKDVRILYESTLLHLLVTHGRIA